MNARSPAHPFGRIAERAAFIAIAAACGIIAVFYFRITLAQSALEHIAGQFEFENLRFTVTRVETDNLRIRHLALDSGLSVDTLDIRYALSDLLNGGVNSVRLTGAVVNLSEGNMKTLTKIRQASGAPPSEGEDTREDGPRFPEVEIVDLRVNARHGGSSAKIDIDGSLSPDLSGKFTLRGTARHRMSGDGFTVSNIDARAALSSGQSVNLSLRRATLADEGGALFTPKLDLAGNFRYSDDKMLADVTASNGGAGLTLRVRGNLDVPTLSGSAKINLDELRFAPGGLQPAALFPLARFPAAIGGTVSARADIGLEDAAPSVMADVRFHGVTGTHEKTSLKGLQGRMVANWPDLAKPAHIRIHAPHAVVRHASRSYRFRSLAARARVSADGSRGDLSLPLLRLREIGPSPRIHPLRLKGKGSWRDGKIGFDLSVFLERFHKGLKVLTLDGTHDPLRGDGTANLRMPPLTFSPDKLKPAHLSPLIKIPARISGGVSAEADVSWNSSGLSASGQTSLSGLSVTTGEVSAEGINTTLRLSSLMPPWTDKPQSVSARRLFSGVALEKPELSFSLSPSAGGELPVLTVHGFSSGFLGGQISLKDFRADPNVEEHRFAVDFSGLDLERLFRFIELEGVSGTGQLSGRIPVEIAGDEITISDGLLRNARPGVLNFQSEKARQALAGGGEQVTLLLNVLEDFHYERLALRVERGRSGTATLGLHLGGHNPAIMDGHAFNLNINLEGNVDRLLDTILEGYRLSDRAIRATVDTARE